MFYENELNFIKDLEKDSNDIYNYTYIKILFSSNINLKINFKIS